MKTIKLFKYAMLISIYFFLACGSDNSLSDEQEGNYFIKAKINETNFLSDFPITQNNLSTSNILSIGGQNSDNSIMVQMFIQNYTGSGTYISGSNIDNDNGCQILKDGVWLTDKDHGLGTITIIENGNLLTGIFSFTAIKNGESISITEGSFRTIKPI